MPGFLSMFRAPPLPYAGPALPPTPAEAPSGPALPPKGGLLRWATSLQPGDAELRPFAQHMYQSIKEKAMDTLPKSVLYGEQGVVRVQVKIQKNGKLLFLPVVISSSGKKGLDRHAISAIRGAVPFDKLPAASPAPIEVHINFYYNVAPPSPEP